jgi:hypothetical protein
MGKHGCVVHGLPIVRISAAADKKINGGELR